MATRSTQDPIQEGMNIDFFKTMLNPDLTFNDFITNVRPEDNVSMEPIESYEDMQKSFDSPEEFQAAYDNAKFQYDVFQDYKDRSEKPERYQANPIGAEKWGFGRESVLYGQNGHATPTWVPSTSNITAGGELIPKMSLHDIAAKRGFYIDGVTGEEVEMGHMEGPNFNDKFHGIWTVGYRQDEEGNIIDSEPVLKRYPRNFDVDVPYDESLVSIWGDMGRHGSNIMDTVFGFASALTVDLASATLGLAQILLHTSGAASDVMYGSDEWRRENDIEAKSYAWVDKFLKHAITAVDQWGYTPSENVQGQGMFESIQGFAYNLGVGLGYLAPQRMVPAALARAGVKDPKTLGFVASAIGTSQAVHDFHQGALRAGISENDAAWFSLAALPAVFATEKFLNQKWLTSGLGDNGRKELQGQIGEMAAASMAKRGIDATTDAGRFKIIRDIFNNKTFQRMVNDIPVVRGAAREGTQETMEESYYAFLEMFHDKFVADPYASVGEGKFGTTLNADLANRLKESFFGGMVLGGIMDLGIGKSPNPGKFLKERLVIENGADKVKGWAAEWHRKGVFGSPNLDPNAQTLTPESGSTEVEGEIPGLAFNQESGTSSIKSMNDANYYNFLREIDNIQQVVSMTGLDNAQNMNAIRGREDLMKAAMDIGDSIFAINGQIEEAKAKEKNEDEVKKLEETRDELQKELDDIVKPLPDGMSKRYREILVLSKVNNDILEDLQKETPDGVLEEAPMNLEDLQILMETDPSGLSVLNNLKRTRQIISDNKKEAIESNFKTLTEALDNISIEPIKNVADAVKSLISINKALDGLFTATNKVKGVDGFQLLKSVPGMQEVLEKLDDQYVAMMQTIFSSDQEFINQAEMGGTNVLGQLIRAKQGVEGTEEEAAFYEALKVDRDQFLNSTANSLENFTGVRKGVEEAAPLEGGYTQADDQNAINNWAFNRMPDGSSIDSFLDDLNNRIEDSFNEDDRNALESARIQLEALKAQLQAYNATKSVQETEKLDPAYIEGNKYGQDGYLSENGAGNELSTEAVEQMLKKIDDLVKGREETVDSEKKVYLGIDELKKILGENQEKRKKREQIRRRGKMRHNSQALKKILSLDQAGKEVFISKETRKALDDFMEDTKDIRDERKVPEEQLIDLERRFVNIQQMIYDDLQKNDKTDAFIDSVVPMLYDEMESVVKVNKDLGGKMYTNKPAYDNTAITNDTLYLFDLNNLEALIGSVKALFQTNKPLGHKQSIMSSWVLTHMNMLNMVTLAPPQNAYDAMLKVRDQESNANRPIILPSIQQEEAIRLGYAILSSGNKYVKLFKNKKYKHFDNSTEKGLDGFFIQAIGGGGKTTVITRMVVGMLNVDAKAQKKKKTIYVVGTDGANRDNLISQIESYDSIQAKTAVAKDLKKDNAIPEIAANDYDVVIIDEASRLSANQFNELHKHFKDKKTKFLFLADPNQATGTVETNRTYLEASDRVARSEMITEMFRTGNIDINNVQLAIGRSILGNTTRDIIWNKGRYLADNTKGLRYFANKQNVVDQWVKDVSESSDWRERVLIFDTQANRNTWAAKLKGKVDDKVLNNMLWINDTEGEPNHDLESAQGKQFDKVYVAIDAKTSNSEKRILNTAAGRAESFLALPAAGESFEVANVIDEKKDTRLEEETQVALRNRLDIIAKDIKYTPVEKKPKTKTPADDQKTDEKEHTWSFSGPNKIDSFAKSKGFEPNGIYEHNDTGNMITFKEVRFGQRSDHDKGHYYIIGEDQDGNEAIIPVGKTINPEGMYPGFSEDRYSLVSKVTEDSANADEPVTEQEKHMYVLNKAATQFEKNGELSISFGIVSTDEEASFMFSRRHTNRIIEAVERDDLQVVFMPEVELYTLNDDGSYSKQMHYNVMAVVTIDNGKPNIIGTLFQPTNNEGELNGRKSLDKNTSYQQSANWKGANSAALNAYANHLNKLYADAKKLYDSKNLTDEQLEQKRNGYITIGNYNLSGTTSGGSAIVNVKSRIKMSEFEEKHSGRGLLYFNRASAQSNVSETIDDEIEIVQMDQGNKQDGYVKLYAYVSYLGSKGTEVPVELRGLRLSENKDRYEKILNEIKGFKEKYFVDYDSKDPILKPGIDFEKMLHDINMSEAMQTIFFNKSMFVDGDVLLGQFNSILNYNQDKGTLYPKMRPKESEGNRAKDNIENMLKALEHVLNVGYVNLPKQQVQNRTILTVDRETVLKMETVVQEIHIPRASGFLEMVDNKPDSKPRKKDIDEEIPDLLSKAVATGPVVMNHKSEVQQYIERVFGKAIANNNLSFSLDTTINDTPTFGYVLNRMIWIEMNDRGEVLKGIGRHEAVHFALKHIVSPGSRRRILNSTKEQMNLDGDNVGTITDRDAEEYLAEVNRGAKSFKKNRKGVTSMLKSFVNWISELLFRTRVFGPAASQFLYDLNSGKFKDAPLKYHNYSEPAMMEDLRSQLSDEEIAAAYNTASTEAEQVELDSLAGKLNKGALVKAIGSAYSYQKMETYLGQKLLEFSHYNRDVNDYESLNIVDSINRNFDSIKKYDTPENDQMFEGKNINSFKDQKDRKMFMMWFLSKRDNYDSMIRQIIPKMNISAEVIETVVQGRRENPDTQKASRSLAGVAKFHIQSTKMYQWKKSGGKIVKVSDDPVGQLPFDRLDDILRKTAIASRVPEGSTQEDVFLNWFQALADQANSIISDDANNETANIIFSFLSQFVSLTKDGRVSKRVTVENEMARNNGLLSYHTLASKLPSVLQTIGGTDNVKDLEAFWRSEQGQAIYNKSKAASELLNALLSHYGSLQHQNVSFAHMGFTKGREARFSRKTKLSTSATEVKNKIKRNIDSTWYFEEDYKSDVLDQLDPEQDPIFNVKGLAITMSKDNLPFLKYNGVLGSGAYVLDPRYDKDNLYQDINQSLKFLGIFLDTITIKSIIDEGINTPMSREELIDMVGTMLANLRSDMESKYKSDLKQIVAGYMKWNPVDGFQLTEDKVTEASLKDLDPDSAGYKAIEYLIDQSKKFKLSDFNDQIAKLAEIQAHYAAVKSGDMTYTVKGNKMYRNTLATPITKKIVNTDKGMASDVLKRDFARDLNKMLAEDQMNDSPLYNNGRILVPLLDTNSGLDIVSIENINGIGSDYFGKGLGHMNLPDYINTAVFGYFVNSVFRSREEQRLFITGDNPADSGTFNAFEVSFGKGKEGFLVKPIYDEAKNLKSFRVNNKIINNLLTPRFESYFKQMTVSFRKWQNVGIKDVAGNVTYPFKLGADTTDKLLWEKGTKDAQIKAMELLQEKVSDHISVDDVQSLKESGLVEGVDYVIDGNNVLLGNATMMRHDIFNLSNYWDWKGTSRMDPDARAEFRNAMFRDRMSKLSWMFRENKIHIPKDIFSTWGQQKMYRQKLDEAGKPVFFTRVNAEGEIEKAPAYDWNPLFEAFLYANFIVSDNISASFFGNDFQVDNPQDHGRRYKVVNSQGYTPVIDNVNGVPNRTLGKTFNMVSLADKKSDWSAARKLFGIGKEVELTDGLKIVSGLHWGHYVESFGGEIGNIREDETTGKTIGHGVDIRTGLGRNSKSATLRLNDDVWEHNPELFDKLIKYFLTANHKEYSVLGAKGSNLYEMYKEYLAEEKTPSRAQKRLKDYVIMVRNIHGIDLLQNTVSGIEFNSTIKQHEANMNTYDLDEFLSMIDEGNSSDIMQREIQTETELMVLNPNQDRYNNKTTRPSQQQDLILIGDNNQDRAYIINQIEKQRVINNMVGVLNQIKKDGGFESNMRKIGQQSMNNRSDVNRMISQLQNTEISIQKPNIRGAILPAWINQFAKGVRTKVAGKKMVQMPGTDMIKVYDVEDQNGFKFIATQKDINENPDLTVLGEARELSFLRFYDKDGNDLDEKLQSENEDLYNTLYALQQERKATQLEIKKEKAKPGYSKEKIIPLEEELKRIRKEIADAKKTYHDKIGSVGSAEVAMQFAYVREFGIKEENRPSLANLTTIHLKEGSTSETFPKGQTINVLGYIKEQLNKGVDKDVIYSNISTWLKAEWDNIDMQKSGVFENTTNEFTSGSEVARWFENFHQVLEINAARIPGTSPASGFIGEIVSITYDSNSTIYTSAEKSVFDDSDYDIDQLTVTFRELEREQNTENPSYRVPQMIMTGNLNQNSNAQLNNGMFEQMNEYYKDVNNIPLITQYVDIHESRERANEKREADKSRHFLHDFSTSAENFVASQEGKTLIAYFANSIRTYAKLSQLTPEQRVKYLPGFQFNGDGTTFSEDEILDNVEYIISTLGEMAQLTVDNPKELIMGLLNINSISAGFIPAMAMNGFSKNEIYDFLDSKAVKKIINKILISQTMGANKIDPYIAVEREINNLQKLLIPNNITQDRLNKINRNKKYLAEHKAEETEVLEELDKIEKPKDELFLEPEMMNSQQDFNAYMDDLLASISNIRDKMKTVEDEIARLEGMSDEEYTNEYVDGVQESIENLITLKEMIVKGEFLRRLGQVFALNQKLPVNDYDIETLRDNLEFFTLRDISQLTNEFSNPSKEIDEYGVDKIGYGEDPNNTNEFVESNQSKVDNFMDEVLTELERLITEKEDYVDPDTGEVQSRYIHPELAETKITLKSTGQSGFSEAALKHKGIFEKEALMPENYYFRRKDGRGVTEYDVVDDNPSTGRFEDVKVTQGTGKLWPVLRGNIENSDVVFDFKGVQSFTNTYTKMMGGKKVVEFSGDRLSSDNVQAIAKAMFEKLRSVGSLEAINMTITGNDLADLNNPQKSDFQVWKEMEQAIRGQGDIHKIMNALPNIQQFVSQFEEIYTQLGQNIFVFSEEYHELMDAFLKTQNRVNFQYKSGYYGFQESFYKAIAHDYLSKNGQKVDLSGYGNYGRANTEKSKSLYINNIDLSTLAGRTYYLAEFARYITDLKNENSRAANNRFLDRVTSDDGNLILRDVVSMQPEEIDDLSSEFNRLDEVEEGLREKFALYNLIRFGYKYRASGFSDFISEELLEEPSQHINKFTNRLRNKDGSQPNQDLWKAMTTNFIENMVVDQNNKVLKFVSKEEDSAGKYPKYAMTNKEVKVPGTNITKFKITLAGVLNEEGDGHTPLYNIHSQRIAAVPFDVINSSTNEAIHRLDLAQMRSWMNNGRVRIKFNFYHGYQTSKKDDPGSYVFVMGEMAKLVRNDATSITLTRIDTPIEASKNLGEGKRIKKKAFKAIFTQLKKANPMFDFEIVNNKTTAQPGIKAYSVGNKIFYNEDLVTADTAIHEFAHPFVKVLKARNSFLYDELAADAQSEINGNTDLYKAIKAKYPDKQGEGLIEEIITTKLGFVTQQDVMNYVPRGSRNFFQRMLDGIRSFWNWILTDLGTFFGVSGEHLYDLKPTDSYKTLAERLVKDMLNSNSDTVTQADIELLERFSTFEASKDLGNAKNSKEAFEDLLLLSDDIASVDEFRQQGLVNRIYSDLNNSTDKVANIYDKKISFKEEFKINDPDLRMEEVKKKIKNDIIPIYNSYTENFKENFKEWLGTNADQGQGKVDSNTRLKYFKIPGSEKSSYYGWEELKQIKAYMDHGPGAHVLFYSDLKNFKSTYPELAESFNEDLIGNDPLIIIHGFSVDESGNRKYDISLFDVSPIPLRFHNIDPSAMYITDNVATRRQAERAGVQMPATLVAARNMQIGLQIMNLQQKSGGKVIVRKSGVIELLRNGRNSNVRTNPMNMDQVLTAMEVLSESDEFIQSVPESIRSLILNDELFDRKLYFTDYVQMLLSNSRNMEDHLDTTGKKKSQTLTDLITALDEFDGKGPEALLAAIRNRQAFLENFGSKTKTAKERFDHLEYRLLSNAAYQIEAYLKDGNKKQMNMIQLMIKTQFDLRTEVLQNYTAHERNKFNQINGIVKDFISELNEKIAPLNTLYHESKNNIFSRVKERIVDDTSYKYERLFMREKINGEDVNLFRVHWDEKDPRTIDALNHPDVNKRLRKEELEIGKFIADKVEGFIKQILRQNVLSTNKYHHDIYKEGKLQEDKVTEIVEKVYNANWEKGMVPVMTKSVGEAIYDKQLTQAWNKMMFKTKNPETYYEEIIDLTIASGNEMKITPQFLSQFNNADISSLGGLTRMNMMGFMQGADGPQFVDVKKNKALTMNLNTVLRYLAYEATSYPIIEKEILPRLMDAKIVAMTMNYVGEGNQENTLKALKVRSDQTIHGKHQETWSKNSKGLKALSTAARMALNVTTFNGVALSVPVAITSLTANVVESITLGVANKFANPHDMFDMKSWRKALAEMIAHPKRAKAIIEWYDVVESDKWDLLANPIYDPLQKHIFTRNFMHGMNRWTDINMKSAAGIAQMIFDGTYYAHSVDKNGNVTYDASKDERFMEKDGVDREVQLAKRDWIKDNLSKDYRWKDQQAKNDLPIRAYDDQDQRKLQMVGSEYVVGVFERDGSSLGNNYLTYNIVMQFKKFMNAKINERLGGRFKSLEGGSKHVYRNQFGQIVKEWKNIEREGSWRTLFDNTIGVIPGIQEIMRSFHILDYVVSTERSGRQAGMAWSNTLNKVTGGRLGQARSDYDLETHNIIRACMDVIWFGAAYLLFTGIRAGLEDEDKELLAKSERTLRAFKNGFYVSITTSPYQLLKMMGGIPLYAQAKRIMDLVMFNDPAKQVGYLVPLGSTTKLIAEQFEDASE